MGVLEDFGTGLTAVPPLVLIVGHCTFVSLLTRALREKFLLSFWVGLPERFGLATREVSGRMECSGGRSDRALFESEYDASQS